MAEDWNEDLWILLVCSVSINACLLLYLALCKLAIGLLYHRTVKLVAALNVNTCELAAKYGGNTPRTGLTHKYEKAPLRNVARILTHEVTSWILAAAAVYSLAKSSVLSSPFTLSRDFTGERLVVFLLSANIGRYLYKLGQLVFGRKLSGDRKLMSSAITYLLVILAYLSFTLLGENFILGLVGLLIESSSIIYNVSRCLQLLKVAEKGKSYLITMTVAFVFSVICRLVVPIVFISYALSRQSPMKLSAVSLAAFCCSICFFGAMNVFHIVLTGFNLVKCFTDRDNGHCKGTAWDLEDNNNRNVNIHQVMVDASLIRGLPNATRYQENCEFKTTSTKPYPLNTDLEIIRNDLKQNHPILEYKHSGSTQQSANQSTPQSTTVANEEARTRPMTNKNLDVHGRAKAMTNKSLRKKEAVKLEPIPE